MISCRGTLSVFSGASGRLDAIPLADEQLTTEAQRHREDLDRGKTENRISLCLRDSVVKKLFLQKVQTDRCKLTAAPFSTFPSRKISAIIDRAPQPAQFSKQN